MCSHRRKSGDSHALCFGGLRLPVSALRCTATPEGRPVSVGQPSSASGLIGELQAKAARSAFVPQGVDGCAANSHYSIPPSLRTDIALQLQIDRSLVKLASVSANSVSENAQ
jgi:hypothetical protein